MGCVHSKQEESTVSLPIPEPRVDNRQSVLHLNDKSHTLSSHSDILLVNGADTDSNRHSTTAKDKKAAVKKKAPSPTSTLHSTAGSGSNTKPVTVAHDNSELKSDQTSKSMHKTPRLPHSRPPLSDVQITRPITRRSSRGKGNVETNPLLSSNAAAEIDMDAFLNATSRGIYVAFNSSGPQNPKPRQRQRSVKDGPFQSNSRTTSSSRKAPKSIRGIMEELEDLEQEKAPGITIVLRPLDVDGFMHLDSRPTFPEELPSYARGKKVNRYTNVLPNPITQVRLSIPEGHGVEAEYVNANYIRGYGQRSARDYIAAQAPTESNVDSFVRMIWETGISTIVMLTDIVENGRNKCFPYFPSFKAQSAPSLTSSLSQTSTIPPDLSATGELRFKGLVISIHSQHEHVVQGGKNDKWVVTQLSFRHEHTNEKRIVAHFWYKGWPDHDVPMDSNGNVVVGPALELLSTVRAYRYTIDQRSSPLLVHCSAGVGRTGTFIAMDHVR